jgi:hypothetical protein
MGDPMGNCCIFYSAQALLNHNMERKFGTLIAESKKKANYSYDEIIREHVYLIPKTKVDHCSDRQVYFNIPENSLKEFEM